MNVSSIGSSIVSQLAANQSAQSASRAKGVDADGDHDGDGGGAAKAAKPVTNLSGQTTGTMVNTVA